MAIAVKTPGKRVVSDLLNRDLEPSLTVWLLVRIGVCFQKLEDDMVELF